jgi:deoxyribonuclease V
MEWPAGVAGALEEQERLALEVRLLPLRGEVRFLAGLDAAYCPYGHAGPDGQDGAAGGAVCFAAAVLWDLQAGTVVEETTACCPIRFPYLPGLLAFRELPGLLAALAGLRRAPDALLCDGHGVAHPRRCGLASHIGVLLDLPSVGCAKSPLVGVWAEPDRAAGSRTALIDGGERVGSVLRTRTGGRPVFVSAGHLLDLQAAERLVLSSLQGHRLPEPQRRAHLLATSLAAGRDPPPTRTEK